ncbi:MGMT family protein [Halobacterium salinarum]|uniref:MGMT family protein n=1 Tax=Halobacterium salinarum TaxID=2242 RepID=UPI002556378F|nr:MGMT family protein [Halobacterium salinarum]MDL0128576.1 MGMT family protein [Halobacterium salinarum]
MGPTGVYARSVDGIGTVQLGIAGDRVISVSFPTHAPEDAAATHPLLDRIADYAAGSAEDFRDVPIGLTLPTPQRRVLETIRSVPYGDRADVELAARMTAGIDHTTTDGHNTVRTALEANPVPLLVPDHRVENAPSSAPPRVAETLRNLER